MPPRLPGQAHFSLVELPVYCVVILLSPKEGLELGVLLVFLGSQGSSTASLFPRIRQKAEAVSQAARWMCLKHPEH